MKTRLYNENINGKLPLKVMIKGRKLYLMTYFYEKVLRVFFLNGWDDQYIDQMKSDKNVLYIYSDLDS